jgi:uncharacterized repeat protein (TIGR03803 family)
MSKFNWGVRACGIFLLWATAAVALPAQITGVAAPAPTFTTLHSFDYADGYNPIGGLVQAADGNFYGTTFFGGANYAGTVFKITPSGTLTTLYSFCKRRHCPDGELSTAALVQATNGNFYGTTYRGGVLGAGTVFKITPSGMLTTLYKFCSQSNCTDGLAPHGGLIQATDGSLYGTTVDGGSSTYCGNNGCGTVFKITPNGALTTLHSFDGADGASPAAGLVQASDGNLYGITSGDGANGDGTVFTITRSGMLTTLHNFDGTDGSSPEAALVQATDGNFYGTTYGGGATGNGTVFKITRSGKLTMLYSFCSQFNCTDGVNPYARLIQATDGNFYGTTYGGGAVDTCNPPYGCGTVFAITPSGMLTKLHSFNRADGALPEAALVQDTGGKFYGTAAYGGASGAGTIFSLSVGLK